MKKRQRGRPKGSKNKPKKNGMLANKNTVDLNALADKTALVWIATYHLEGAERLAELTYQKIIAQKIKAEVKYG